jgi:hypothetical protein
VEYYSGILFLTTNRPGTLDEAFKSRIHVSLRYPGIDQLSTEIMWTNIMKRLESMSAQSDIKVEFDKDRLLDFAKTHFKRRQLEDRVWNGRQIRNAFQTAIALGHADRVEFLKENGETAESAAAAGKKKFMKVKLTTKNFRKISKTTQEFEDYLVSLRGKDSEAAKESEVRDDDYDPDLPPARKTYGKRTALGRTGSIPSHFSAEAAPHARRRQMTPQGDSEDDDDDDGLGAHSDEDDDDSV